MLLTVRDVARVLAVSENTVERWAAQSGLPAMRLGGQFRFNRIELLEWATIRQIPLDPEVFHLGGDESGSTPSLRAALQRGGVDRSTGDLARALVEQADALELPPEVDRDELRALFRTRGPSTYGVIAGGIVVPHARYPIVVPIAEPRMRLCYLDGTTGNGGQAGALFILLSPTVKSHLTLLAVLVGALADARFADAVKRRLPADALLAEAARFNGGNGHT